MEYRYLHIIHNDKFIVPFIDFVAENFNNDEHLYVYFFDDNVVKYEIPEKENVLNICNRYLGKRNFFALGSILTPLMKKAERIYLHGLFSDDLINYLFWHKRFLSKCYWLMWGGDLYGCMERSYSIRNFYSLYCRRSVIRKIAFFVTYVYGEFELAVKKCNFNGEYLECFLYPNNFFDKDDFAVEKHKGVNILVGNSADPSNNHFEIFDRLLEFRDSDMQIYVPLSYSSRKHAKEVEKRGYELFGDKFRPLMEYMPKEEYMRLLDSIDVAVFAHRRQQAMGNIISLLGMGKKVYMRSDITPWFFFEKIGIKVYDFQDFNLEPIENHVLVENRRRVANYFSKANYIEQLKRLFGK